MQNAGFGVSGLVDVSAASVLPEVDVRRERCDPHKENEKGTN